MSKIKIFGWETEQRKFNIEDDFELAHYTDDEEIYLSKKTFKHDVDGPDDEFEYKYAIHAALTWWEDDPKDQDKFLVEFYLVVSLESAHEEIIDSMSIYDEPADYVDMLNNGNCVLFGSINPYLKNWDEVHNKVLDIVNVYEVMDRFRGFSLDRAVNRIGNTGWDIIWHIIHNEDFIQKAFDRYKEVNK